MGVNAPLTTQVKKVRLDLYCFVVIGKYLGKLFFKTFRKAE